MEFKLSAFADESSDLFSGQIDALKRNGLDFLEIRNLDGRNVTALSCQEAREHARILSDNGLALWSMGSPIGKIAIDGDFDAHMDLYRHTLDLAGEFGAKNIRLFSFFMPKDENPENYETLVLERMEKFAEVAKEYGVTPCHENEKGIFGDVASRCLKIHRAVPGLKAVFDPANFVQCGQDTLEAWELLNPYVHYMHIKDAMPDGSVVPPGMGSGNVPALIRKYHAMGGQVLSLEPHLYEFVGLKSLEQEGEQSVVGAMSFATAEEAFDHAAITLKHILEG
jgi:sugar phosphate isomerase/epimerase